MKIVHSLNNRKNNNIYIVKKNHSLKYLLLCPVEDRKSWMFGATLGWVTGDDVNYAK